MFNVWVEDSRMIRSHINQLRSRTNANSKSTSGSIPSKTDKQQLALDILLRAWNLHKPTQPQPPGPSTSPRPSPSPVAQTPSTLETSAEHSTPQQVLTSTPASPSLVWVTPESTTSSTTDLGQPLPTTVVPSSSTTSPVPLTLAETETAFQVPRRSSRLRRPPIRFDPYQLY
ncbi:platelet glycoprotein Ib alpha chain-like [Ochlerotatus camptorhynchus]|uniref:platelet glycoprotein Ib alpha chain-like n=1 Tax=Ochlerotatus camptorhynchus TaxID=644619 RepID=UPI0031D5FC57